MPLSDEDIKQLTETFDYNDLDDDGRIDFDEFCKMLADLEAGVDEHEARVGFREIDTDRDGAIELDEFIEWWSEQE
jgi:Ca2+-binding EF-hand superfamily protein